MPGVAALAVNRDGVIYDRAFGRRALGGAAPMTPDTVFWIASMTKAVTATAVMQLVEQGRLDLDADCGRLVAALANPRVLTGFDAAGKPTLRPARGAITLRHLLTYTAGFAYEMWNAEMLAYSAHTRLSRNATFRRPEDVFPLAFDPGTGWAYGIGIDWAGKVLEAVTGQSLADYFDEHIFAPLAMTSSGYALRPGIAERLANQHQRHPEGRLEVVEYSPSQKPDTFLGGGGLYSTTGDYGRFMRMILNGGALDGRRVLAPETVAAMSRSHTGSIAVEGLRTAQPLISNDADFFPGMAKAWGLSFLINTTDVAGRRSAGSLCWAGLRNTYYWIDPKRQIAGTVMTQILPFADAPVLRLFEGFETEIYRATA